jgi:hypothetical protein
MLPSSNSTADAPRDEPTPDLEGGEPADDSGSVRR